eukprot:GHVO01023746.1.p1 GENE.GHVO01023746.1~~GHVO01023746.1.p1  ORF type:complete len:214 (-),score=13.08 GHVO01023746.1:65-706(-)
MLPYPGVPNNQAKRCRGRPRRQAQVSNAEVVASVYENGNENVSTTSSGKRISGSSISSTTDQHVVYIDENSSRKRQRTERPPYGAYSVARNTRSRSTRAVAAARTAPSCRSRKDREYRPNYPPVNWSGNSDWYFETSREHHPDRACVGFSFSLRQYNERRKRSTRSNAHTEETQTNKHANTIFVSDVGLEVTPDAARILETTPIPPVVMTWDE